LNIQRVLAVKLDHANFDWFDAAPVSFQADAGIATAVPHRIVRGIVSD
jgi:hypothetical protein